MPFLRLVWFVPLLVVVAVAATPSLRTQARDQLLVLGKPRLLLHGTLESLGIAWDADDTEYQPIDHTDNRQVVAWVEEHYPDDPEMLMAAGAVLSLASRVTDVHGPTPEGKRLKEEALALLSRGIDLGAGASAWVVYVETIVRDLKYSCAGIRPDPDEREEIAAYERGVIEDGLPQSLPRDQGEHALHVLRGWQRADPENGVPVALEAWVLYGLHRDSEAMQRWKCAGRLPVAAMRSEEVRDALQTLLTRMGYPRLLATGEVIHGFHAADTSLKLLAWACMARNEGRRAQIAGRSAEAVALWLATADLGAHMQASADTILTFMYGLSVERRGASPVWEGRSTSDFNPEMLWKRPEPPSFRYYFGAQHTFFVEQVGQTEAAALRERLLAAERRLDLWRATRPEGPVDQYPEVQLAMRAGRLLYWTPTVMLHTGIVALLYVVLSLWPRRQAQTRTTLSSAWQVMLAIPTALAIPMGLVATLLATAASRRGRPPSQSFGATCRENLRRHLPIAIALGSLLYLWMTVRSVDPVETFVRRSHVSEMDTIIADIGPEWHEPTMLPGSWVAEYPPELATE